VVYTSAKQEVEVGGSQSEASLGKDPTWKNKLKQKRLEGVAQVVEDLPSKGKMSLKKKNLYISYFYWKFSSSFLASEWFRFEVWGSC
jgi:hypothetical protein